MTLSKIILSSAESFEKPCENIDFMPDSKTENNVLNIYPDAEAQTFLGFGGAFTESSAYNFAMLDDTRRSELLNAYFSADGLNYSFCRTHIGSCDFSLAEYAYTEPFDRSLDSFELGCDRKYIIPFIKAAQSKAEKLFLFASPWSPPAWMKTTGSAMRGGALSPEWSDIYGEYIAHYILAYQNEGIDISAVTVQNEPLAAQT